MLASPSITSTPTAENPVTLVPVAPKGRRESRELAQTDARHGAAHERALFSGAGPVDRGDGQPKASNDALSGAPSSSPTGVNLRDESGYVDLAIARPPVSVFTPLWPTRVHTVAVWLIAILPLLLAVLGAAHAVRLPDHEVSQGAAGDQRPIDQSCADLAGGSASGDRGVRRYRQGRLAPPETLTACRFRQPLDQPWALRRSVES